MKLQLHTEAHRPGAIQQLRAVIAALMLLLCTTVSGAQTSARTPQKSPTEPQLTASVITCWPGPEVYELYGHTALRIKSEEFDSVWNYGMFNFYEPGFVSRFVAGELYYYVGGYPFVYFMPIYRQQGRRVEEQVLNLTQEQIQQLRQSLQENALPQNAVYQYDYIKDNCSTRVWDQVQQVSDARLKPQTRYASYRQAMRAYHSHYPWYSLGIDIALAYPVDTAIKASDHLFLPLELHKSLQSASRTDGAPLVSSVNILNSGIPDATLAPTPWYLTPTFCGWILLFGSMIYCFATKRKPQAMRIVTAAYYTLIGIAGSVVAYLVFCSIHKAASPNLLLIWLNPLAFIVPALIFFSRARVIAVAYMIAETIALILISLLWPFQTQCGNPAFIPLILTTLLLSIVTAAQNMPYRQ